MTKNLLRKIALCMLVASLAAGCGSSHDNNDAGPTQQQEDAAARASDRKPVLGREGGDPAGFLRVTMPGLQVVGYHSNPSRIELPAEKFNAYLEEEGLDSVLALRVLRKETASGARELYSRCAK